MYEHIVFDLDGTLVDSLLDLTAAVNHVRRVLGLAELPAQTVRGYVGEGARLLVQRALGALHRHRVDEGLQLFLEFYGQHLLDHTRPYPGIVDMLSALSARPLAAPPALSVLSNKPAAMSRAIVDGLGLSSHFRAVLGGDSLPTRKPDPGGLAYLQALTRTAVDRMLVVGDSLIDVRTARAAGCAFCGVAWGFGAAALRAADVPIIAHPLDLLAVVGLA